MPNVVVLGSTGVIGSLALEVISGLGEQFRVVGLAANRNIVTLSQQARVVGPEVIAVADADSAARLAEALPGPEQPEILSGSEAIAGLAARDDVDIVVNAITGAAGLAPTIAAVRGGKRVALANKESLVMAGDIVMAEARRTGAEVLPVDSEHSAIFQSLEFGGENSAESKAKISRVILTASGGPFYDWPTQRLRNISPDEAMQHPTWRMGPKISIDSATMMNKAMEIIEARHLFDLPVEKIAVLIHPQSIVHSLVEYVDGSFIAQMGPRDMRLPIQHALTWPERRWATNGTERLDLTRAGELTFIEPDYERFPALELGFDVARRGGTMGAVLNAADEEAVAKFRAGKIRFVDIVPTVDKVMRAHHYIEEPSLDEIFAVDEWARREVKGV